MILLSPKSSNVKFKDLRGKVREKKTVKEHSGFIRPCLRYYSNGCIPIKRLHILHKSSKNVCDKKFNKQIRMLNLEN